MIFSRDVLFIHIPKTGGMSVSDYLLTVLPGPVYYTHPGVQAPRVEGRITELPGSRHETLEEAVTVVRQFGFDVRHFPVVLAVVRNPYDVEVSRYSYLRKDHPWDAGYNQQLALMSDFETFAVKSHHHAGPKRSVERYITLDGRVPANVRIARAETLEENIRAVLSDIGIDVHPDFPWSNRSDHDAAWSYYNAAAEEAVYEKYRWLFDEGFYPRMQALPVATPATSAVAQHTATNEEYQEQYEVLCRAVKHRVCSVLPSGASVLIVSKGDDSLLQIGDRRGNHFPQSKDGDYAGAYPGDSREALHHLEALRLRGADFLVFPSTAFWWLDHYREFARALDTNHERVWSDEACLIYDVRWAGERTETPPTPEINALMGAPGRHLPSDTIPPQKQSGGVV
jgi:hypothetical protein